MKIPPTIRSMMRHKYLARNFSLTMSMTTAIATKIAASTGQKILIQPSRAASRLPLPGQGEDGGEGRTEFFLHLFFLTHPSQPPCKTKTSVSCASSRNRFATSRAALQLPRCNRRPLSYPATSSEEIAPVIRSNGLRSTKTRPEHDRARILHRGARPPRSRHLPRSGLDRRSPIPKPESAIATKPCRENKFLGQSPAKTQAR